MNHCLLMAVIFQPPQLRYTPDNLAVAEMTVQIDPLRSGDPVETMKVICFGNLATDVHQGYQQGDRVLLEGRLGMNLVDRPEGFKEKLAEMTIQRIYRFNNNGTITATADLLNDTGATRSAGAPTPAPPAPTRVSDTVVPAYTSPSTSPSTGPYSPSPAPVQDAPPDYDDIPF